MTKQISSNPQISLQRRSTTPRSLQYVLIPVIGMLLFTASQANDADEAGDGKSIHHVNSGIDLPNGVHAGELHTVNGSISVGDHAVIASAGTVNGSVRIGDDSQTQKLSTVNGKVIVGKRTVVSGYINSVNGRLELGDDAIVKGDAKNVNSEIRVGQRAHVTGDIITDNGDVTLENNAHVDGRIKLRTSRNWFTEIFGDLFTSRVPVITIGPGAAVDGDMEFERKVKLRVHSTAKIGAVKGAVVEPY